MEPGENNRKLCPFIKADCVQEKCTMWVTMHVVKASPLGVGIPEMMSMCVFQAQLIATNRPQPQPVRMNIPSQNMG